MRRGCVDGRLSACGQPYGASHPVTAPWTAARGGGAGWGVPEDGCQHAARASDTQDFGKMYKCTPKLQIQGMPRVFFYIIFHFYIRYFCVSHSAHFMQSPKH